MRAPKGIHDQTEWHADPERPSPRTDIARIAPSDGPIAVAMPPIPATSRGTRASIDGHVRENHRYDAGVMSDQPSACTTRAAINTDGLGANAHPAAAG